MPDTVTPEVRSRMMAGIRGKNTRPEMLLRKGLHARGWRYRLHGRDIPGRPDLVFAGRNALIFVNGCFWHGHDCHLFKWPKTRDTFWREKIGANVRRDIRVRQQLLDEDWRIAEVWECTLKGRERRPLEEVLTHCETFLGSEIAYCSVGTERRVPLDVQNTGAPASE